MKQERLFPKITINLSLLSPHPQKKSSSTVNLNFFFYIQENSEVTIHYLKQKLNHIMPLANPSVKAGFDWHFSNLCQIKSREKQNSRYD